MFHRHPNHSRLIFAALWLVSCACSAASFTDQPLSYRVKNSDGKTIEAKIPFIVSDGKAVADRVNMFLHQQLLHTIPPADIGNEAARVAELDWPVVTMDSSGVGLSNGGRVLSVTVGWEGCGAYCTEGETVYDFDARNGRALVRGEIITPQGRQALAALAIKQHGARLRKEIAQLRKPGYKSPYLGDEDVATQLDFYERCLNERYTKGSSFYEYNLQDPGAMTLGDGELTFTQEECSYHAVRGLDDLGAFTLTLKGEQLRPYLSAYGKYVLLGEGEGKMPAINPYAQVFKGRINGSIAVTMYLGEEEAGTLYSTYSGTRYLYDKYRKPIELSETRSGGEIVLTESGSEDKPQPALTVHVQGGKLVGQWSGGGKTYPFEAMPY